MMTVSAVGSGQHLRFLSWNPFKWGRSDVGRASSPRLEDELPEIFAHQPDEVDDYIRPEKSLFERLEDLWDWILSFMQPIEKQMDIMRSVHSNGVLGYEFHSWGHVLFFYGICLRLLTLLPSLYSHRNSLRMGRIGSQISELTNSQNKAKNDRTLSTAEKRVLKDGYNRMKHALYQREGCAQWKSFGGVITAPLTASAFFAIRRLTLYEPDLQNAPFLWIADLSLPDPTMALPMVCGAFFLFNFELNQRMQRGGRSAGGLYIRWGTRVGAAVGVYIFSSQPAALFAYWIGLSCAGLLQPILLRWQPFRNFFSFPDPPLAAKASIVGKQEAELGLIARLFSKKETQKTGGGGEPSREAQADSFERIDDYDVAFETGPKK